MAAQESTPDAKQFTDQYVQANGLRFHYLDWGSPEKPPLVLLHGVGQTCHTWDLFAAAMSEHFHVMAFDQRGHGDTDWAADKDYSRASMVEDANAFTDALESGAFFLDRYVDGRGKLACLYGKIPCQSRSPGRR